MTISLQVSSMVCDGCVSIVKDAIISQEPTAKVEINLENKNVQVDTQVSEATIRQIITAAGHTVE